MVVLKKQDAGFQNIKNYKNTLFGLFIFFSKKQDVN